jgi:hypothetical protein
MGFEKISLPQILNGIYINANLLITLICTKNTFMQSCAYIYQHTAIKGEVYPAVLDS